MKVLGSNHVRFSCLAIGLVLQLTPAWAQADRDRHDDNRRFDGVWDTVLSCPNTDGALGFSFRFPSVVKDGVLHGEKGTKGVAGWLQIDGRIPDDGKATLYADGLVGAAPYAVGHIPGGTEYGYHIDARFEGDHATGKRVEGRPCDIIFSRTRPDPDHRDRDERDADRAR